MLSNITMVVRAGIEPATRGFSVHCSTNWATGPWLREKDLNQRPPGYEPDELPDCSIPRYWWRRNWDSNPGAALTTYRFSRPDPSTAWVFLRGGPCRTWTYDRPVMGRLLWPTELRVHTHSGQKMVAGVRFELTTSRVWTERSNQLSYPAKWSGWQDLNLRPPGPKPGALPSCATSRYKSNK